MIRFNVLFHKMDKPIVGVVAPPRNNGRNSLICCLNSWDAEANISTPLLRKCLPLFKQVTTFKNN